MNDGILVNRIDLKLDQVMMSKDFTVLKITSDLGGKQHYGQVINTIYKEITPLSLCNAGKGAYYALVHKEHRYKLDNPHFAVAPVIPIDLNSYHCAKLLIGALPYLSGNTQSCEGVGLYYLSDIENIRGTEVIRTFEIKIEQEQGHLVLKIDGATFTPITYHTNAQGELYGDCTHLPRFKFDRWSQSMNRSKHGEFIKKAHRSKRMRSDVVSLDTKNPSKFWNTKAGILALFMSDVEKYLEKYLSIQFDQLSSEYRVRFKDTNVKETYQAIDELLKQKRMNLINLTEIDIAPLQAAFIADGITVHLSNEVDDEAFNLAVHHSKEFYEDSGQIDPYQQLRASDTIIIQSAYPDTLLKNGELVKTTYEACKKELLVKWEVVSRRLKLLTPVGNWLFIVCKRPKDIEESYFTVSSHQGELTFAKLNSMDVQEYLLNLPKLMTDKELLIVDLDNQETYLIEETKYIALPNFAELAQIMKELDAGYDKGIQREWVTEFLNLLEYDLIDLTNKELVVSKLGDLLKQNPLLEVFGKKEIFGNPTNKIAYKGSMQSFFDWVALEKGLRLGASLKAQDSGYIEASLGLFYSEEEKLYFVGDKDNVKSVPKFCRIRRIVTDADEVPNELLRMMEAFHIRHKQPTVYPFLFKHLREFFKID
ncbi:hypothetical protein [Acinetobacter haemolyticus]|uniref:hypothetical protein n=1 Tax=Acinetobacter haemolyticus TaxID=29430 RepID=UPI001D18D574|nr:hypothetical protein [Acinetobacter haemolyticus]